MAFSRQGQLLGLVYPKGRLRKVEGDSVFRREEREYNLELEDQALIRAMQESLLAVKTFPILALIEAMGLTEALHPPRRWRAG